MTPIVLFPLAEYWWFCATFTGFMIILLALDPGVFHRDAHVVGIREAAIWTAIWILMALGFNYLLYQYALWKFPRDPRLMAVAGFNPTTAAWQTALEFLSGYIVEKSLSVDNMFVLVVIFTYFATPTKYQHQVLFYGILGALIMRAIFIALGSLLLQYHWIVWIFGAFLILTGLKLMVAPERGIGARQESGHPPVSPVRG